MELEKLKDAYRKGYDQGMLDALELLSQNLKDIREDLKKKFKEAGYGTQL